MNETIKTLETRRSVRCFDAERMPSEEMIKQIVEAGEYAPTGRGKQSPRIVVVTNKQTRDLLSSLNARVMGVESAILSMAHRSSCLSLQTANVPHTFMTVRS